jgi:hypothetical protein
MFARTLFGCVALCVLTVASLADEPKEKETKLKPTAIYSGTHSQIRQERFELVPTKEAWGKLWEQHRGNKKDRRFSEESLDLEIDFESHYVVAIFLVGWDWCSVTPQQRGDTVVIGYEARIWQIEGRLPGKLDKEMKKQIKHQKEWDNALAPYAFVVLPKPVKTVIIEQGKRQDLTTPPEWKERTRFPAPKDKK